MAQRLKCLPGTRETWVRSLGQEDPLKKENGNPLQYSCLENPMEGGAWWAAVHGVTKSQTRLSDVTSRDNGTSSLFSSHHVAQVLELQLQHQSFQ